MDLFIFDLLLHSCLPYDILCVILIFANECLISAEMQPDQVFFANNIFTEEIAIYLH